MKKSKKLAILIISIIALLAASVTYVLAATETGVEGYYSYTKYNSKVTITDVNESISGDIVVPSKIDGCDVITIGEYAFENCTKVTSITVPEGITTINKGAFKGMTSLNDMTIPFTGKTVDASGYTSTFGFVFDYVTSAAEGTTNQLNSYYYYIPASVTSVSVTKDTTIPANAFYNCANIEEVTLDAGVTSIGNYAFYNCTKLKAIPSLSKLTAIGNYAFDGCTALTSIEIPSSVTSIGSYAFNGCSAVTNIDFNDATTSIGDFAFANIPNITTLEVSKNATSIGKGAFYGDNKIVNLSIPYTGNTKTSSGYAGVLGYIFSWTDNSSASGVTYQNYSKYYYYIPTTIKSVTLTNDTGVPDNAFFNCANIESVTMNNGITSIGANAFTNCEKIKSINLPDSVTSIGSYAFSGYSNLETVTFSNSLETIGSYAFSGCIKIKELNLPASLKTINSYAFQNLLLITELVIPDSVTSIGNYAFCGMNKLEEITIPFIGSGFNSTSPFGYIFGSGSSSSSGVTYQGSSYYYIPKTLRTVTITKDTTIPENAFYGCSFLTEINIPDDVPSIGNSAFCNCSGITEIELSDKITTIPYCAFAGCTNLGNVELPSSLKTIGEYAFSNCKAFTSVELPNTVTSIGGYAFNECSNLETVTFSNSLETIGDFAFSGCSKIKELNLPSSLKTISSYAFQNLSLITELVIPDSVTSIVYGAFKGMDKLEEITIPFIGSGLNSTSPFGYIFDSGSSSSSGVTYQGSSYYYIPKTLRTVTITKDTTIPENAFYGCSFLTEINIPDNVTSIGNYAFYNCSGIVNLFTTSKITSIGNYAFSNCSKLTVFGNKGSYTETYCSEKNVPFVADEDVASIAVKTQPTNKQHLGKPVDATGLVLTATLNNGKKVDLNSGYSISTDKLTAVGNNTVKVSFAGKETSLTVNATGISSIAVVTMPSKTEYFVGYDLDCSGMVVKVTYIDATVDYVTSGYTTNVTTLSNAGDQIVKVSYYTASTFFKVKVHPVNISKVEIATVPSQLAYFVGDTVNTSGLTLKVTYTDGTSAIIDSNYTVDTVLDSADIKKVVIDYNGFKVSYDVTVTAIEMLTWSLTSEPMKLEYNQGDSINTEGLVITEYYNNGTVKEITSGFTCTPDKFDEIGEQIVTVTYKGSEAMFIVTVTEKVHEHSYETVVTVPTCEDKGYTTYTCECGDSYVADYVDAKGHSHTSEVTTPATHTTTGVMTYTCHCGDTYTETIAKIEKHEYKSVVTAPTCTEQGYTTYTCECGESYVSDYVDETGHSYTSEVTTPATHTTTGVMTYTCHCGDTYTETIDKIAEHKYESVVTAPTCTEQGYTTYTCSCGDSYVSDYVDETGHSYTSEVTTPATHTTTGVMTYTCSCGDTYTETIDKIEKHEYKSVVTAPTCTDKGYTTYTCSCGDSYVDNFVPAKGHTEGKWVVTKPATSTQTGIKTLSCSVCGAELKTEIIPVVTVKGKVHSVSVSGAALDYKGSTTLNPQISVDAGVKYTVTYSSSNPSVASVDANGKVSTGKTGSATITVTVTDEYGNTVKDTCEVKVSYNWWQWIIVIVLFGWIWY